MTEIPKQTLADILLCAFRYAIGRKGGYDIAEHIIAHWKDLECWQRMQIQQDIHDARTRYNAHDFPGEWWGAWRKVLDLPCSSEALK